MDKIRVYEAAKKLNIKTKELINLLLGRGIAVKSPISFISQSDFESLLNSMTASGKDKKPKSARAKKKKRAVKSASALKKEKSKLSLVPPLASEEGENPEVEKVDSTPEPEKKIDKKMEPAKKKHGLPKKHESVKSGAPVPLAEPAKPKSSLLSYLTFAMAAVALLITIVLSFNVSDNTSGVNRIGEASEALKAELAAVNDGIRINQDLIFENRDSIANVQKTQARLDLSKLSAALEELAPSLPAEISKRVLNISKGMNSLASSL